MSLKRKPPVTVENVVTSQSLTPSEPEPMTPTEVTDALAVESSEVRLTLVRPCFINGRQYGPGECMVPKDAFHVWKACI